MPIDLPTLTTIHTLLSLIGLVTGVVAIVALFDIRLPRVWTQAFLTTAIATSVTGFGFPLNGVLPSHVIGAVALVVLACVLTARYRSGAGWRRVDAIGIVASEYFLMFVAVAQAFSKIPPLRALAPTQSEPPFAIAELVVLVLFVSLGIAAGRRSGRAIAIHVPA
ncbi:MAG: hypothetical protein WDN25_04420 [Acetobacteraceae bacterium]